MPSEWPESHFCPPGAGGSLALSLGHCSARSKSAHFTKLFIACPFTLALAYWPKRAVENLDKFTVDFHGTTVFKLLKKTMFTADRHAPSLVQSPSSADVKTLDNVQQMRKWTRDGMKRTMVLANKGQTGTQAWGHGVQTSLGRFGPAMTIDQAWILDSPQASKASQHACPKPCCFKTQGIRTGSFYIQAKTSRSPLVCTLYNVQKSLYTWWSCGVVEWWSGRPEESLQRDTE
ncbi:hypothetical protein EGW08_011186 [Elysia chlorotica]|uniref:Uncharacterized protein n=1 Tax=Elysia chlorotica TaxID=188477 RepID=A0A433THR4_ELYCH|nr:hypothetical protein EGW08_011186 [Elysia chlorotica]